MGRVQGNRAMKIEASALTNFSQSEDGSTVTLTFQRADNSIVDVELSLESISRVAPELLRMCIGAQERKASSGARSQGYKSVAVSRIQTLDVRKDATQSEVILILDGGSPNEIAYSIPPDGARRMGEGLIARAAECNVSKKPN